MNLCLATARSSLTICVKVNGWVYIDFEANYYLWVFNCNSIDYIKIQIVLTTLQQRNQVIKNSLSHQSMLKLVLVAKPNAHISKVTM